MQIQNTHFDRTFGILSQDTASILLKNVTFNDLKNLSLVSKKLLNIIQNVYAQVRAARFCAYVDHNLELQSCSSLFWKAHSKDNSGLIPYLSSEMKKKNPLYDTLNIDFESANNLESCLREAVSKIQDHQTITHLQLKYIVSNAENYDAVYEEMKALVKALPKLKNLDLVITLRLRIDNSVFRLDNQLQNFVGHLNSLHLKLSEKKIKLKANYEIELFIETNDIETIKEQIQELFYFPKEQANVSLLAPVNTLCKYLNPEEEAGSLLEEFISLLGELEGDLDWVNHLKLEYLTSSDEGYQTIYAQIIEIADHMPNLTEMHLTPFVDMYGPMDMHIDDAADEWIAFRTDYEDFLSRLPDEVTCIVNFQPAERNGSHVTNIGIVADARYELLVEKSLNIILGRETCALEVPKSQKDLIKEGYEPRTFFFSGFLSELEKSLNSIDYRNTEHLSIRYILDTCEITTNSLRHLKKLKKITISPSFSFGIDMDNNAWDQIKHEYILDKFYEYTKANKIAFVLDLAGLAYPVDKEGLLNITDPVAKQARQTLVDANFSVFLDHLQKYLK